jgi:prevent-host-death family protein
MRISVTEAKALLTELIRRAEAGEDIVLTRHGQPTVRLAPIHPVPAREARRALIQAARESAAGKAASGPAAARSQDFLYDATGLPE